MLIVMMLAVSFAIVAPAAAQTPMPKTINLHDNATGKPLGTITQWGNKLTVRDANGELIGTIVVAADGKRTFFDPNGKPADMPSLADIKPDQP